MEGPIRLSLSFFVETPFGFLRTFCRDPPIGSLQKLYGSGSSDYCDVFDPAVIAALLFFVWLPVRGSDHGYGVMVLI